MPIFSRSGSIPKSKAWNLFWESRSITVPLKQLEEVGIQIGSPYPPEGPRGSGLLEAKPPRSSGIVKRQLRKSSQHREQAWGLCFNHIGCIQLVRLPLGVPPSHFLVGP